MGKERRFYSEEYKRDAVRRLAKGEHSLAHVARDLGVNPSLLQNWRRKYAETAPDNGPPQSLSSLEEELRRLRRENASLREDREILKKAAAFFAKEPR